MHWMEIEKLPYKVWWVQYDENNNEIDRGVLPKEYKHYGHAHTYAEKFINTNPGFYTYKIAKRDPYKEYTFEHTCDICGKTHERPESRAGYDLGARISAHAIPSNRTVNYNRYAAMVCPDCFERFRECMNQFGFNKEKEK